MKNSKATIFVLFLIFLFFACKKEDYPTVPVIEYKSISSTEVTQFSNTVTVRFSYEDFQGDLGNDNADINSLRIKDDRLADYDWYHVPPMTPDNQPLHIKGTYTLELHPLFLLGNGGDETTRFKIQIRDRAGNWSNEIVTPVVTIQQ